jgi:hypothetical protein
MVNPKTVGSREALLLRVLVVQKHGAKRRCCDRLRETCRPSRYRNAITSSGLIFLIIRRKSLATLSGIAASRRSTCAISYKSAPRSARMRSAVPPIAASERTSPEFGLRQFRKWQLRSALWLPLKQQRECLTSCNRTARANLRCSKRPSHAKPDYLREFAS